jgi:hypothetical protein
VVTEEFSFKTCPLTYPKSRKDLASQVQNISQIEISNFEIQSQAANTKPKLNRKPIQTANQINSQIPQSMYEVHNPGADTKPKLIRKPDSRLNPRPKFQCC